MNTHARKLSLLVVATLIVGVTACNRDSGILSERKGDDLDPDVVRQQLVRDLAVTASFSLAVRQNGSFLTGLVSATNLGSQLIEGNTGPCLWSLRAYRSPGRSGQAVWGPETDPPTCGLILLPFRLEPGDVAEWRVLDRRVEEMVALLGSGTFYLSVELVFAEPAVSSGELPVGEITLP